MKLYLLLIRWWNKNPMEKIIIRILMIETLKLIENVFWKKGEEIPDIFGKSMNIKIIIINFDFLYNLFE